MSRDNPSPTSSGSADDLDELTRLLIQMPRRIDWTPLLPEGLRLMEVAFLRVLESREALGFTSRISDLADDLGVSRPTATNVASLLTRLEYIEKSASEADRRTVLVSLTPKGHSAVAESRELQERTLAQLTDWLGAEDTRHLTRILRRVNEFFEQRFSHPDDTSGGVSP